jgi:hypothetical protein
LPFPFSVSCSPAGSSDERLAGGCAQPGAPGDLAGRGDFWDTVLFRAGLYRRNALTVRTELRALFPLGAEHFARWLALWTEIVDEHFAGHKADLARTRAARVAASISRRLLGGSASESSPPPPPRVTDDR